MYQARARTFQTVKSLNYLYKVCTGTNASRSYWSVSSFKAVSFVKKITTLHSPTTYENVYFLNPNNEIPVKLKNITGYCNYWSLRQSNSEYEHQNLDGVSIKSSKAFHENTSHEGIGGGKYFKNNPRVQENQGNSLPDEKSDEAVEEKQLPGTIEELDAFCKDRKLEEALEVFGRLEQNKVSVDIPRYLSLMKACGESQALEEAKYVHHHLTRSVPHLNLYICNKILEMYLECGSMEDAYKEFIKMPQRNLTTWDTMITWLAKNGHGEDAIEMFTEFKNVGLKPDSQMFFGVFTACSVVGDMREGLLHFESMTKTYNLVPLVDHYVSVVDMLGSSGYLYEALEFIKKMSIEPSVDIWEIMMNQCRVHGDLELGDRCAEMVNLLDPSRLDEQSKKGLLSMKTSDMAKEKENERYIPSIFREVYEFRNGDTSHPDHEKLYCQLRCLKQQMKEVGYVPDTRFVQHCVDQESLEEALLSHSERLALSKALLTSSARAPIKIIMNRHIGGDGHNAFKIISKLVGRLIFLREGKRSHHFENGVCSCRDLW